MVLCCRLFSFFLPVKSFPGVRRMDADHTPAAAQKGITTVHGSAFECRLSSETCSLLYLNPPYDSELGPHSNKRMELVFLEHCYRWVTSEGVLVFVIPTTALDPCARLLASQFDRLSVFRSNTQNQCGSSRWSYSVSERSRIYVEIRKGGDVLVRLATGRVTSLP